MRKFPFIRPLLPVTREWQDELDEAYRSRWFSNFGVLSRRLEASLASRCRRAVLSTASGTAALIAVLLSLPEKGTVILPSFTFPATLQAVLAAGHEPLLADVDPCTWELGIEQTEAALFIAPQKVVAVLAVRVFGLCRDLSTLEQWCALHDLDLIVDAAAALGGELADGTPVGAQGMAECFSMHATKVFAIGEGGAIATNGERLDRLRSIINFGMEDHIPRLPGFNGKLSEFTAAVGLVQQRRFDEALRIRHAVAERYHAFFKSNWPHWQRAFAPGRPPWQTYPLLAPDAQARARLMCAAGEFGIELRRYYHPTLHLTPIGENFASAGGLTYSESLADRMICFPVYSDMSDIEQEQILGRLFTLNI